MRTGDPRRSSLSATRVALSWWLYLARRRVARPLLDGVLTGLPELPALLVELVDPPWWRLDRWAAWLRCPLRVELMVPCPRHHGRGWFVRLRAREA